MNAIGRSDQISETANEIAKSIMKGIRFTAPIRYCRANANGLLVFPFGMN
jgi:uncharacterized protein with PhoU and TrkA domain